MLFKKSEKTPSQVLVYIIEKQLLQLMKIIEQETFHYITSNI